MYQKHDSFVAIKHKEDKKINLAINRIVKVAKDSLKLKELSLASQEIFKKAINDLTDKKNINKKNKFILKSNVVAEINTIEDKYLPKYLVHRYRYEIFPQTKKIDEFPPYLQIEPTSICNYRCVFCFETDGFFINNFIYY